jgi:hypothetical protein
MKSPEVSSIAAEPVSAGQPVADAGANNGDAS